MNIRDVRTRWINVDKDVDKAKQMEELLDRWGFKDHQRVSAVTGIEPHEAVRHGEEHYRNCAESHFKVLEETILKDEQPVLILEDDVEIETNAWSEDFPIPEDADAIYFGTSHGDNNYQAIDEKNGWLTISKVFSTHAILHISPHFSKKVIEVGKHWIYDKCHPFDVGIAYDIQSHYKVYAPKIPVFYQADSKNSVNKWEGMTRNPLNAKKRFTIGTMS